MSCELLHHFPTINTQTLTPCHSPGQSQLYLEQVRERTDCGDDNDDFLFLAQIKQQFSLTVGSCSKQWVFLSDLSQLSSILDRYH